ncbi:MAG TPA: transcription antitermination factor NusB [Candidatus Babeliales bacterium]|nr:transcription antitermination factor NusB [Candidatus Babeliales bacterium]
MAQLSRRGFRSLVFHLLYALDAHDYEISQAAIIDNFNRGFDLKIDPVGEEAQLVTAILQERAALDLLLEPLLANWKLERLGTTTKLILRLGIWELLHTEIPASVVINEAVELTKDFDEPEAYKFVNGVLDQLAKQIRGTEAAV